MFSVFSMLLSILNDLSFLFEPWVSSIPSNLISSIAPIALIVAGFLIEKHYVARPSIFLNAVALNIKLYYINSPYWALALYANAGIVIGAVALASYSGKRRLPSSYYTLSYSYNSVLVGVIVLFGTLINTFLVQNAPLLPIYYG